MTVNECIRVNVGKFTALSRIQGIDCVLLASNVFLSFTASPFRVHRYIDFVLVMICQWR